MEATLAMQKPRRRFNFRGSLCMPFAVFMALFVVFPLLLIVFYAFTDEHNNFTFDNWGRVFSDINNWKIIGMTFVVAAATTFFSILIAYPIAYLLSNSKYNKNRILVYIFLLPMWVNFVIRTVGLRALINGVSNAIFGVSLTSAAPYVAIIIGMVYDYLPFAILPLYNQMLKMDKNQIEAAADLGANPFFVFTKTIIPMTIPGIVSACMMTFMPTMSSYVIVNKMSGGTKLIIGNLIQSYFTDISASAEHVGSTLSLVMLFIIGVSIIIEKSFDKKEEEKARGVW